MEILECSDRSLIPRDINRWKDLHVLCYGKGNRHQSRLHTPVQDANGGNGEGYVSAATAVDQWIPIEGEFVCKNEGITRLCINYGKVAGTYYIDNFKFGEKKETATAQTLRASTRRWHKLQTEDS